MAGGIKVIGTVKGVSLKSKVGDDNRTYHTLGLTLELTEGIDRVQEIVERVKEIVELGIDPKQPRLGDR